MVRIPVRFVGKEPEVGPVEEREERMESVATEHAEDDVEMEQAEAHGGDEDAASMDGTGEEDASSASSFASRSVSSSEETEAAISLGRLGATLIELDKQHQVNQELFETSLAKSVTVFWAGVSGLRPLVFDDRLDAQKLRTTVGKTVSELTQLLLEIDQVSSYGNAVIRKARKSLVVKLNEHQLPRAENLLSKVSKLVDMDENLRTRCAHIRAAAAAAKAQKEEAPTRAREKGENKPQKSKSARNQKTQERTPPEHSPKLEHQHELEFQIKEMPENVLILSKIPRAFTADDVHLEINRETGELLVAVRGHEIQSFDITHRSLLALRTSYRVENGTLVIQVPKRSAPAPERRCRPMVHGAPHHFYESPRYYYRGAPPASYFF
jgi:hypothetical protein